MKFSIWTLGCKLNQSESESIAKEFIINGFVYVDAFNSPDIFIINSCTVTSKAEQKARRVVRKIIGANPDCAIIMTGCYAEVESENLKKNIKNLFIIKQLNKSILLDLPEYYVNNIVKFGSAKKVVENFIFGIEKKSGDPFAFKIDKSLFKVRAFLKIEDGCNNSCSFCRVTIARGSAVSLDVDSVVSRVIDLERAGYLEVVLTGVNICMYNDDGRDLNFLVKSILENTEKIRIRLSSVYPDFIDEKFLSVIVDDRVCPHFHLSIQSGSDAILKLMGRFYRRDDVYTAIKKIREKKRNPFIAADIIVGFPGESEADFEQTYSLIADNKITYTHVFPYSPRPGTTALTFPDFIPERIRDFRVEKLNNLSDKQFEEYKNSYAGKEVDIIIESIEKREEGYFIKGIGENYLKIEFFSDKNYKIGEKIKTFFEKC